MPARSMCTHRGVNELWRPSCAFVPRAPQHVSSLLSFPPYLAAISQPPSYIERQAASQTPRSGRHRRWCSRIRQPSASSATALSVIRSDSPRRRVLSASPPQRNILTHTATRAPPRPFDKRRTAAGHTRCPRAPPHRHRRRQRRSCCPLVARRRGAAPCCAAGCWAGWWWWDLSRTTAFRMRRGASRRRRLTRTDRPTGRHICRPSCRSGRRRTCRPSCRSG